MHDEGRLIEGRVRRETSRVRAAAHGARLAMSATRHELPGEPAPFDVIAAVPATEFTDIPVGTPWGRPWGTTWFRLTGTVPADWPADRPVEAVIELGFVGSQVGFQAEGLVWSADGEPLCGIHPERRSVRLDAGPGDAVELLVEAASNPNFNVGFGPNPLGSLSTAGDRPLYIFGGAWLAWRNDDAAALHHDLGVLARLMTSLPEGDARRARLTRRLADALDRLDLHDIGATAAAARTALAAALELGAEHDAHRVFAIGHAHIDTAWLWPIRETVRKCTRTFANAVELMDEFPEYRFGCSQAAQYAWIETRHPALFERITAAVERGQWVPIGGMWVEADMNLPSGESIVRQLIHGQRYFESRFGRRCTEVWIPDVFGYPASMPQIFAAAGCTNFVTQKLSWNKQNRMPHHTFWWEGIDGSRVLTHFPPVDTYNAEMQPDETRAAADRFRDKAWSDASIMPFGHGDGGGGPTRAMLERARRMADLEGVPRISQEAPSAFFDHIRASLANGVTAPEWRGELYFEMHRGTLTSQIGTKVGNRRNERLLREAEVWWATTGPGERTTEVMAELDAIWKEILVLQFHDIIPGSSIAWVHEEAEATHERLSDRLEELITEALVGLCDDCSVANAGSYARNEIAVTPWEPLGEGPRQQLADGRYAYRVVAPALGVVPAVAAPNRDTVVTSPNSLSNGLVEVRWDAAGRLTSFVDRRVPSAGGADRSGREVLRAPVALTLAPDHPVEYDAWDLERWTAERAVALKPSGLPLVVEQGPLLGAVRQHYTFGRSSLDATWRLTAGSARLDVELDIDWQEDEKVLCLEVPVEVHASSARCGIQFGHVERPTHANTSWDAAKFEVCAHRWVDVSEPSFGVALLDDGRYGHSVQNGSLRVTLLRAPNFPDPRADRGHHRCTIAVLPHGPDLAEVLRDAEALNMPLRPVAAFGIATPPVVSVDGAGIEISAAKLADDGSGDLIVRIFETLGDRTTATLSAAHPVISAALVDIFEDPATATPLPLANGRATLPLRPFQLATIRLSLRRAH